MIKILMISDILILTSFGLTDPIIAIFFKENLKGGTILMAGLASTVYFVVKCAIQLPFSRYVDSHSDKARMRWLILGSILISATPFIYIFAEHVYVIFAAQVLHGIGSGLAYPTWLGLWSTHLDKKKESFEWSLYSTLTGLGTATTAAVGAALSQFIGFTFAFTMVGTISLTGSLMLLCLEKKRSKLNIAMETNYHKKRKLISGRHRT